MKMSVKLRRQLESAKQSLEDGLNELQRDSIGVAKTITKERSLGSDYSLNNPKCMESTSGLAEHVRINPIHGSKIVYCWTALDTLKRLLADK